MSLPLGEGREGSGSEPDPCDLQVAPTLVRLRIPNAELIRNANVVASYSTKSMSSQVLP